MSQKQKIVAFERFVNEFKNESDRAAVILGAAKIDTLLSQILDRHLVPSTSSSDELLDGEGPLSTFSARINICFRLGLISADFAKALHIIRRIRNSFAHELSGAHLESGPHADRVNALVLPLRRQEDFMSVREIFFDGKESTSVDFRTCLALIMIGLESFCETVRPVSVVGVSHIREPKAEITETPF